MIPYIYKVRTFILLLASLLALAIGCDSYNLTPDVRVIFQDPQNVTETGFTLIWSIKPSDYSSMSVILARDPSFRDIVRTRTYSDHTTNTTRFDSLQGATEYFYRISIVRQPGSLFISPTKSIHMPFQNDMVSFSTADSATLKGFLSYLASTDGRRPAVIFMHEFGIFVNGWINSDLITTLVSQDYVCLVYFNRGHGSSSSLDDLHVLIEDPKYLANDLRGAMAYLAGLPMVRPEQMVLAGASMGASMAVTANGSDSVLASVALSPADSYIDYLYPGVPLKNILYIVGENDVVTTDQGIVNFPEEAQDLYNRTTDPRKLIVVSGTDAHGTELLESPGVNQEILDWILAHAPVQP
jgi:dienelactone hydrolase